MYLGVLSYVLAQRSIFMKDNLVAYSLPVGFNFYFSKNLIFSKAKIKLIFISQRKGD